jgi:hypothetical protein
VSRLISRFPPFHPLFRSPFSIETGLTLRSLTESGKGTRRKGSSEKSSRFREFDEVWIR